MDKVIIYKQDVLDALRTCYDTETITMDNGDEYINYEDAVGEIEQLPPAPPQIVRCKDCTYGKQDDDGRWYCIDFGCQVGNEDGSGFCSDAERRE